MNRLSDEWFTSKSEKVPLWHKIALSIDEMYVYTGIGRETIRELTKQLDDVCLFRFVVP